MHTLQANADAVSAKDYFLQQHRLCVKSLLAYNRSGGNGKLHQLRVAIKKIKSLLVMMQYMDKDFDRKNAYAAYKTVFKRAGTVRTALLQNQQLKPAVKIATQADMGRLNRYLKTTAVADLKKAESHLAGITKQLNSIKRKQIVRYCGRLLKPVKKLWEKDVSHAHIHKLRKRVKHFLYCADVLTAKEKSKIISHTRLQQLEKLQRLIGQWHDSTLLLNRIKKNDLQVGSHFIAAQQQNNQHLFQKIIKTGNKMQQG